MATDDKQTWLVLRTDDAGNNFLAGDGLDEHAATALVQELTARGHKQSYVAHMYATPAERALLLQRFRAKV